MPRIHPTAVVETGAQLADDVVVGPLAYIGPQVRLGAGCVVHHHASLEGHTVVGEGNQFFPHSAMGCQPQDLKYSGGDCRLTIGDRNLFRENVTVHIGTETGGGHTRVGSDGLFMVGCHIAHDCDIGDHVIMANNVLLAGHVEVQDWVVISGGSASHHFVRFGRHAFIGGLTSIVHDVPPFMTVDGRPGVVRGMNSNGLKRRGYTAEQLNVLKVAYRMLYHSTAPIAGQMIELERKYPDSAEVRELLTFIRAAQSGKFGRYKESLRGTSHQRKAEAHAEESAEGDAQ
jgi:UDP-N-acetylglucosamine acyltransferase